MDLDLKVRLHAFRFLEVQVGLYGEVLPRQILAKGFLFEENRVPLVGPQGIFKPHILELPLTITTAPIVRGRPRPYDDGFEESGFLRYRYRGEDPNHRDNVGLREVMHRRLPMIYFHGIAEGRYMACWPAYLVYDNPAGLCFSVALDDHTVSDSILMHSETDESVVRRTYVTALVRRRMHQQSFRERVLQAYREHCAVCRLRHSELLEAAHILPDIHERGRLMPMFRGSASKVIFANLPWRSVRWFFGEFSRDIAEAGLGAERLTVRANIRRIRKAGVVVSRGEVDPGRVGISAPVFGPKKNVLGSISLVMMENDASPETIYNVSALVDAAGRQISAGLVKLSSVSDFETEGAATGAVAVET